MRGRIVFARAQVFGRCGAVALRALGELADSTKGTPLIGPSAASSLAWLVEMLSTARPRELRVRIEAPIVLYVDGACEDRPGQELPCVTVGAVLLTLRDPTWSSLLRYRGGCRSCEDVDVK